MISADALTVGCRRNVKPELAEVKGKRILIAAELEEGMRLSTSIVKQLSSTDEIEGEKKYKDPFKFRPTHTLVLYTNHLPKVGAMDTGIWRRLIVIPFDAKITGSGDIKNYSKYLLMNAGPYITKWIIEGAQKAMGLGKTAVSLTAVLDLMFDSFEVGKVLIIASLRVAKTVWPAERDAWEHTSFLQMSVVVGSAMQREAALRKPADTFNYLSRTICIPEVRRNAEVPIAENNTAFRCRISICRG